MLSPEDAQGTKQPSRDTTVENGHEVSLLTSRGPPNRQWTLEAPTHSQDTIIIPISTPRQIAIDSRARDTGILTDRPDHDLGNQHQFIKMHTGISKNSAESRRKFSEWKEEIREWLLEEESFSAMLSIKTKWEDTSTTFPRRDWSAIRDFYEALRGNIPLWIRKIERRGLSVLAAHAERLLGAEGSLAITRQNSNLKLLTNKEAWKALSRTTQQNWLLHLSGTESQTFTHMDPRMSSWNVGPHGYKQGRTEILALFEQGDPIICLQDLKIPTRLVPNIKQDLHNLFSHYWVFISTSRNATKPTEGVKSTQKNIHYNFTTLTALDSSQR